tara:strand:+ start:278 stop:709 length:432 start_codon:yes stop_codon:yes gene_type:complete
MKTKPTITRSPYKVGQKLTVAEIKVCAGRTPFPSKTGGFIVTTVVNTSYSHGGYLFNAESVRPVDGSKVEVAWHLMHPRRRAKNGNQMVGRKQYFSAFRVLVSEVEEKPYMPRTTREDMAPINKTIPAGSRKKALVLADFLEA